MPTDILLDDNLDLRIEDGDFATGDATRQHQTILLLTEKGENREFPTRGVGLKSWQNDDVQFGSLNAAVKREFELDGMTVTQVRSTNTNLQIEAVYE